MLLLNFNFTVKKAEKRKANDEPTDPETPRNKHLKLMFVLLMMPHVGPMIRQYNVFYSILLKMFISGSFRISWLVVRFL
jgi:hypothetical protein